MTTDYFEKPLVEVKTPYGSYHTRLQPNKKLDELALSLFADEHFYSLNTRIQKDYDNLNKCDSLEDVVKTIHSLVHKISECINTKNYELAVTTYKNLQTITTKFNVSEDIK